MSNFQLQLVDRQMESNIPGRLHIVDLGPQLPPNCPVNVQRWFEVPNASMRKQQFPYVRGEIHMWFNLTNMGLPDGLEIGSLGLSLPMVMIMTLRQ